MKRLLQLTILLSVAVCWSHNESTTLDKDLSTFISKLETRGVTSYFTTDRYCDGVNQERFKPKLACDLEENYLARYIFWEESGKTMMKLLDNCGTYTSYPLKDNQLTDFFASHLEEFKSNTIKPYSKATNNDVAVRRGGSSNCRRVFMFKNNEGAFIRNYNMFDLSSNESEKNINKTFNNSMPLVQLDKMIDAAISSMESSKLWKRM